MGAGSAFGAVPAHLSVSLEFMGRLVIDERVDERVAAIDELMAAADEFAARAQLQETCRDGSRPGTGSHHQHAHLPPSGARPNSDSAPG
jgi:hypothetical protein